jgi:hypothetical protein
VDETELEQNFDMITMALKNGYPLGARKVFEKSIQKAVNKKLDQALRIVEQSGAFYLIEEIKELKFD